MLAYFFIVLVALLINPVDSLKLKINPVDHFISGNYETKELIILFSELRRTEQYKALSILLRYETFNFNLIYEATCKSIALDEINRIILKSSIKDQKILLSPNCLVEAKPLWDQITTDKVSVLPSSPLASPNFKPFNYKSSILTALVDHSVKINAIKQIIPIDFNSWLTFNLQDYKYFPDGLLSVLNGKIFADATIDNELWILDALNKRIGMLVNYETWSEDDELREVLQLSVLVKSIYLAYTFYQFDKNEHILNATTTLLSALNGKLKSFNHLKNQTITIIKNLVDLKEYIYMDFLCVINVITEMGFERFSADWLVGLLMCNFSVEGSEIEFLIKFIIDKNPHYLTLEAVQCILEKRSNYSFSKRVIKFFKSNNYFLENPKYASEKPLRYRYKDLRSFRFSTISGREFVAIDEFLHPDVKPQRLMLLILNAFSASFFDQSGNMALANIFTLSLDNELTNIDRGIFFARALNTFLDLSELFTTTSEATVLDPRPTIIPNPFLPEKFFKSIMGFLIHHSLLGFKNPFKIDKNFFMSCFASSKVMEKYFYSEYQMYMKKSIEKHPNALTTLEFSDFLQNNDKNSIYISQNSTVSQSNFIDSYVYLANILRKSVLDTFPVTIFEVSEVFSILFG